MRNAIAAGMIAATFAGCGMGPEYAVQPACPPGYAPAPAPPALPTVVYANPVFIPIADPQCAWETVVEVVGDYFRIQREEPVRIVANTPIEGTITTFPQVSPTIFEPWRHDTVDPDQRVENTLQSMRRRAVVRVTPAQGGYSVDVAVFKDLENVVRPEHATAGSAAFRYDSTLTGIVNPAEGDQIAQGWIEQGHDASLEQHIIANLLSRCGVAGSSTVMRAQDR